MIFDAGIRKKRSQSQVVSDDRIKRKQNMYCYAKLMKMSEAHHKYILERDIQVNIFLNIFCGYW